MWITRSRDWEIEIEGTREVPTVGEGVERELGVLGEIEIEIEMIFYIYLDNELKIIKFKKNKKFKCSSNQANPRSL